VKTGKTGTVNHLAVLDDHVVGHCSSCAVANFADVNTAVLR
jgi:uncharacterized protein YuzB (UPF0349 family)